MADDSEDDTDPWAVLSQMARGHDDEEDDGEPIDYLAGGGRREKLIKTPLDKAKHLVRMRKAYTGFLAGSVDEAELKATVQEYHQMMSYAHEYLKSGRLQASFMDGLQEADRLLSERLLDQVEEIYEAVSLMKKFFEKKDQAVLQDGYRRFETAMKEVSKIQGDAFDRANSLEEV